MKISIIILIYNVEKFLSKCIFSAINQTYQNIEIILVNDGSTDNSLEICEEFKRYDKRVRIINKSNGGLASARRAGVFNAIGNFVVFLDGDDYLNLDALEILLEAYDKSNADIIIASANYVFKNKILPLHNKHNEQFLDKHKYINYLIEGKYPWMLAAKLFKIEVLKQVEMPYYKVGQDAIVCFQCVILSNKLFVVDQQLYNYVQHNASASFSKEKENIIDTFRFANDVARFLKEKELPDDTKFLLPTFELRWFILALHKGGYKYFKDSMEPFNVLYSYNKNNLKLWERTLFTSYNLSPFLGNIANFIIHLLRKAAIYLKRTR